MRFILNFIFFGILFYLIYLFFPEAFAKLVSWANDVYQFFSNLIQTIAGKTSETPTEPKKEETHQAAAFLLFMLKKL